ncbi:hypothetical protein [Marinitoga sp. 38H-ov]|uniref:hypothetical protein n=1 Tax=Marinitoga sp. 38H-ov TaxID=1755814 RepID=UPI0013E9ADF1|nr:hypothetical protein [Marinitoga sp. 38H-ov]KAF2956709.1 hypothetical protein AS160_04835 [Marinitoga sp. 38H-ov]
MKKGIFFAIIVLLSVFVMAEERVIEVKTDQMTWMDIPYAISFSKMLDIVGEDFDANWYSIRVIDENGNYLPYQIDDIDGNQRISSDDILLFTFKKSAKIVISDDSDMDLMTFEQYFTVTEENGEYFVKSNDFDVKINKYGLANIIRYKDIEGTIYNELGTARIAGWSGSTYYIDGKLGKHVEFTSSGFDIENVRVLEAGPIAVTVVSDLYSRLLPGLNQHIITHIFKTGDVLVKNTFEFTNYVDLMKLQVMATAPITSIDDSALHILPMFRRMVWAEQINGTPLDYWTQRNAVKYVNGKPYIEFSAIDSMKPLWWGATYAFVSEESWRANFSPKYGLGAAEILPEKPVIYSDLKEFVFNDFWFYESREFRDGIFRWLPGEMDNYEATKGVFPPYSEENVGNHWMAKFKAGDVVEYTRYYSLFQSRDANEAIDFLEKRTMEIQKTHISE